VPESVAKMFRKGRRSDSPKADRRAASEKSSVKRKAGGGGLDVGTNDGVKTKRAKVERVKKSCSSVLQVSRLW